MGKGDMGWGREAAASKEPPDLDLGNPSCFSASLRPRAAPNSLSQLQILSLVSWGQACLWSDVKSKLSSSSVWDLIG